MEDSRREVCCRNLDATLLVARGVKFEKVRPYREALCRDCLFRGAYAARLGRSDMNGRKQGVAQDST